MMMLLKYEFRKTLHMKLIALGCFGVLELCFLIGLYAGIDELLVFGVSFLTLLSMMCVMLIGLESLRSLHRDMNTRQSYMLFMTPHTGYAFLGAKVLECSLSVLLAGAFCIALGTLDVTLLFGKMGYLEELLNQIRTALQQFNINQLPMTLPEICAAVFMLISGWLSLVITAALADIICSALLNGKRYNGLIGFLIFLVLSAISSQPTGLIPANTAFITSCLLGGGISILITFVMYLAGAMVMDRYLSV